MYAFRFRSMLFIAPKICDVNFQVQCSKSAIHYNFEPVWLRPQVGAIIVNEVLSPLFMNKDSEIISQRIFEDCTLRLRTITCVSQCSAIISKRHVFMDHGCRSRVAFEILSNKCCHLTHFRNLLLVFNSQKYLTPRTCCWDVLRRHEFWSNGAPALGSGPDRG